MTTDEHLATNTVQPEGRLRVSPASLLVVEGATSRRLTLPRNGTLLAGRDAEADLQLESPSVSRRHAELFVHEGSLRVMDLESHNGTRVNGELLTGPRTLVSGDLLMLGEVELLYRSAGERGATRRILEWVALQARLEVEVERARALERPLSVVVLARSRAEVLNRPTEVLDRTLSALDVVGLGPHGATVVVLPERDPEAGLELAELLVSRLARHGPAVGAGLATLPVDGCDAASVLAAAEASALVAAPGEVCVASRTVQEAILGERRVLVADPAMVRLYDLIRRLAASDLPVLISGETGVGKENAAWAVHWHSKRSAGPFVSVNCAALTESLVESELFGHERGAFTGADKAKDGRLQAAAGGTLFLDEVGELPLGIQAKLLRVLETRRVTRVGGTSELAVDLRIVAATNRDLQAEVEAGRFRRDLFFRLGAAVVVLPPLRDRPVEITLLARRFLEQACAHLPRGSLTLTTPTLLRLQAWDWPGNVRELRNLMEFCAATVLGDEVEPWHLPDTMVQVEREPDEGASGEPDPAPLRPMRPLVDQQRDFERQLLLEALGRTDGVRTRAAQLLGLPLRTFKYKLKQHGLTGRASSSDDAT